MIWTMIEYLATLVQCFVSTEFVTRYLGFKSKKTSSYMIFTLAFIIQVMATLIMNKITIFEGVAGLIYPAIVVIYGLFILKGSIFEKIIIACIDNGLKMITSISILTLISYLSPLEINHLITEKGIERLYVLVVTQSTYFFLTRVILRLQKNNKFALSLMEWGAILLVFITSFATGVFVFEITLTSPNTSLNDLYSVLVMVGLILINVLCYYIFVKISIKNREKLKYSLIELRLIEQEKNLLEMKRFHEEIRKIRHDMKNHIECAAVLLHNGKNNEASIYLNNLLTSKMSLGTQIIMTKSDAINAVLSNKLAICKEESIKVTYEITGSVEEIPEVDLSILLANILDNAIEASIALEAQREINIKIYDEKNYLVILVGNYIQESVLTKNPGLLTTKKNKLHHGFGSISINDVVSKYNGMISRYEENERFYVDVWLAKHV
jgi:two-component system, LytTR family, sensor histidine kinase AgrC